MTTNKHDCAVTGCGRPHAKWSRWCVMHAARNARNGHPEALSLDKTNLFDPQLAVARRYMQLYGDRKATVAAVELARSVMHYRASTPLGSDVKLELAWEVQRHRGADPAEIAARVVAFYLFTDARPGYFKSQRAEDVALGRLCLHSAPLAGHRYNATVYSAAGDMIRSHLGVFALTLIKKVGADAERVAQLKAQSANLEA